MSTATLDRPVVAARPRPRLLLPPVPRPATAVAEASVLWRGPAERSVLTAVTEAAWPVVAPAAVTRPAPPPEDPTPLAGAIVLATVEALAGTRPVAQLTRWVTPELFETLQAARRARQAALGPGRRLGAAATPAPTGPVPRARVRRTLLARLSETAAEGTVVVHDGARVRAAAVRLEVHRSHWRATALEIG